MPRTVGVKVKMFVDEREIVCEPNQTVLDAARENGVDIPTICYNPLYPQNRQGSCRLCLVEVVAGGRPGLQPSCTLPVSSGLKVSTRSDKVYQARRTAVELLLSEHEQKCRDCAMSGDCAFAELCKEYDIDGVSVCAECPNQGEGCYLSRGVLCMGPLTYANCDAYCTRQGYPCEGCHTLHSNDDVLRAGIRAYAKAGFSATQVLDGVKVFTFDGIERLRKLMGEEGMPLVPERR